MSFGSFLPMMRIQELVLFISRKAWFNGILFYDWLIYDMLWCSQYCDTITIGVPLGGILTRTSNISSLINVWSERSIFNVGSVEVFVTRTSSEPGKHTLPNLLLCSSNFSDEQYLSFLVCGSYHFIVDLLFE